MLDSKQIEDIIRLGKKSISLSKKKNEKAYRVSLGGGRDNAMQIKTNHFEDIF